MCVMNAITFSWRSLITSDRIDYRTNKLHCTKGECLTSASRWAHKLFYLPINYLNMLIYCSLYYIYVVTNRNLCVMEVLINSQKNGFHNCPIDISHWLENWFILLYSPISSLLFSQGINVIVGQELMRELSISMTHKSFCTYTIYI